MRELMGNKELMEHQPSHTFRLRLFEGPLELAWKHCDLVADFLGKLHAEWSDEIGGDKNEIRHNVSYIINEMLENAHKFGTSPNISLETGFREKNFQLRVINPISREVAIKFQELLSRMETEEPSILLIDRLEQNAANPDLTGSGLGLLTLMSDYAVEFCWKFDQYDESEVVSVETLASLPLD